MRSSRTLTLILALIACQILDKSAEAAPSICPLLNKAAEGRKNLRETVSVPDGGVVLFRHDEKKADGALSLRGQLHARSFGWAFSNASVADVVYFATNKPRVKETAELAFPEHTFRKTKFGIDSSKPTKQEVIDWASKIIKFMSKKTLVFAFVDSRIINQFETKDTAFACGEGLLLRPDAVGTLHCKARFFPEEWLHSEATLPPWINEDESDCAGGASNVRSNTN